jgi:formylglycine-generating enzyme required for sulfatase activity
MSYGTFSIITLSIGWLFLLKGPGMEVVTQQHGSNSSPKGIQRIEIPSGEFEMGTSDSEIADVMRRFGISHGGFLKPEVPKHKVRVDSFEMDVRPVTNGEFAGFLSENPEWRPELIEARYHNGKYLQHWNGNRAPSESIDTPVVNVSWYAAQAYCQWAKGRLPTEAEFEWAARGGLVGAQFPWGDQDPSNDLANWSGDSIRHAVESERYPPNGYGLYGMAGNVWQFCLDEWQDDFYSRSPILNPAAGIEPNDFDFRSVASRRVIRGGSWGAAAVNMRVTFRDSHPPTDAGDHVGFRCITVLNPSSM